MGRRCTRDLKRAAYLARLDALARIDRKARRRGEMNPGDLVERLVATAENPLTRGEATSELRRAQEALRQEELALVKDLCHHFTAVLSSSR